ncbi:MAG: PKD domain-containing protein, partial [Sulfurovaceae bacterium]|nr:PKD domain-containing protein [Sulfurovaceae bacterium]
MKYIFLFIIIALIVLIITQGGNNEVKIEKTTQNPNKVYTHIYHEVNIVKTPNPIFNIKPTVDAGDDQVVVVGQEVTLKAVASDKDGKIISYEWKEDGKLLSNKESFSYVPRRGYHKLIVSVKDNHGATVSDEVTISAGKYYKSKIIDYKYNGEICITYITRNSEGNITKREVDNGDDGSIDRASLFSYDENGEMLSFEYNSNGETYLKESYLYDESGKLVEEEESSIWQDGIENYKYEYDDNGRKVRATVEEDGVPSYEELSKYDSSSKVI